MYCACEVSFSLVKNTLYTIIEHLAKRRRYALLHLTTTLTVHKLPFLFSLCRNSLFISTVQKLPFLFSLCRNYPFYFTKTNRPTDRQIVQVDKRMRQIPFHFQYFLMKTYRLPMLKVVQFCSKLNSSGPLSPSSSHIHKKKKAQTSAFLVLTFLFLKFDVSVLTTPF